MKKQKQDASQLEERIGIKFRNRNYLTEALTHRSYLNEHPEWRLPHNERLEFLGDAVLELITTEFLFTKYTTYNEGHLTSLRAALVNAVMLAQIAKEIKLEGDLLLSKGESKDATSKAREIILANAVEALIGAVYLDQGYEAAKEFIHKYVLVHIKEVIEKELYRDPKSLLQEIIQESHKVTPTYRVLNEIGPDHNKKFFVGVYFGESLAAEGNGNSKQEAEVDAAKQALRKTKKSNY